MGERIMNWQTDKEWSDQFIPEIKLAVAPHVIGEATEDQDRRENTDLIVLRANVVRIACRIRQPQYFDRYPGEITIRSKRPGGNETELSKIVRGWGDMMFYGHEDPEAHGTLRAWVLGDLSAFRLWFSRMGINNGNAPGVQQKNRDGSSFFRAFQFAKIPGFIVASKMPEMKHRDSVSMKVRADEYRRASMGQ